MTDWPTGDGEMAGLIRTFDWSATPLGPIAGWPQSLRVATRLLLNTRHPMFIWWGPELIQIYNDAYRDTMGPEKHPAALGGAGWGTWAEIWDVIGPQIAQVMRGGPATWHEDQLVPVTRHGGRQQVWWTYSFSPIDDDGSPDGVGGVMVICRDVTAEHFAKRAARESEARYRGLFEAMEEGYLVADVIFDADGRAVDIEYYEANPAATRMVGLDVTGRRLRDVDPGYEEHWYETFGRVAQTGISEQGVLYAKPGDIWYDFHVSRLTTSDPTNKRIAIRFFDASERIRAELALRQSEERQAYLLELSDALRPLVDPIEIQHVAMQVLGRRLGVSRAQYYVADETGEYLSSSGGYTDGVPAAVGSFRLIEFGRYAYDGFHAGQTQVVSDATTDPRISETVLASYEAVGFLAYIGVPFVQRGRLVGTVAVHQSGPRRWTDAERMIVEETAERAGIAVEQARAEAALRESEERFQQFADASAAGLWIRDAATLAMEYVSPAIGAIYGVQADALLGDVKHWASMILPEDRDTALGHLEAARSGDVAIHQFRIRRPSDGALRWIRNTDFPLRDNGHIPRIGGIAEDVTETKRASDLRDVMVAELQHRTRNLIAVVRGVADDTMDETGPTEAFRAAFFDRLSALSRVQELLSRSEAEPITIGALVRLELDAIGARAFDNRVTAAGPAVYLRPSTVQTLALALHELATNARKYGALSHEGGHLAVTWRERDEGDERRLALDWVETGLERAPERAVSARAGGYGRELIEQALPHTLGARTSYALTASGVRCSIDLVVRAGHKGD